MQATWKFRFHFTHQGTVRRGDTVSFILHRSLVGPRKEMLEHGSGPQVTRTWLLSPGQGECLDASLKGKEDSTPE